MHKSGTLRVQREGAAAPPHRRLRARPAAFPAVVCVASFNNCSHVPGPCRRAVVRALAPAAPDWQEQARRFLCCHTRPKTISKMQELLARMHIPTPIPRPGGETE